MPWATGSHVQHGLPETPSLGAVAAIRLLGRISPKGAGSGHLLVARIAVVIVARRPVDQEYYDSKIVPFCAIRRSSSSARSARPTRENFGNALALLFPIAWPGGPACPHRSDGERHPVIMVGRPVPEIIETGSLVLSTTSRAPAAVPLVPRLDRKAIRRRFEEPSAERMARDIRALREGVVGPIGSLTTPLRLVASATGHGREAPTDRRTGGSHGGRGHPA